jgi:hypothetical protein
MSNISLYGVGGWIVAGIGVSLFLLGFFARRVVVRSEPQCAKCGYPLDDIPRTEGVVICPECGREPKNPTETYTLRRRKGPMAIGAVLFVGALVLPTVPTMQRQGWAAALPMSVQIRMWATGDKRLRERVARAYRDKDLSDSQLDALRISVRQALRDPNTPMGVLADAVVPYIERSSKKGGLLGDKDRVLALLDENLQARQLLLTVTIFQDTPESDQLRAVRRTLTGDRDKNIRTNAIRWLLSSPSEDEEDRQLIRELITQSDEESFRSLSWGFDRASPIAAQIAAELLSEDDPALRLRGIECVRTYFQRDHSKPAELDIELMLSMIDDPDPDIRQVAIRSVENLPLDAEPTIGKYLGSVREPEMLSKLIHHVIRRRPTPVGLMPALAEITRDEGHSLMTRLDAADAYVYVLYRAEPKMEPEELWEVYDALILALSNGDFEAAFGFGKNNQNDFNPWAVGAIGRLLLGEGIERDQLGEWFAGHPAVEALLGMLSPGIDEPVEAYRRLLIDTRDEEWYTPDRVRDSINRALETYFPDALDASQP